jgi:choline dehydrogenase-like flavoprotein
MIRSLTEVDADLAVTADVHVVGGGIAGLLIATRLARRGLRVIVTESGGWQQAGETHPLNEVVHLRSVYQGAEHGRARCLGGTSTLWGGAMIPFLAADMQASSGWPVSLDDLIRYLPEVEAMFDLPAGPYEAADIAQSIDGTAPTHIPRLAKWPAFGRRNVAALLDARIKAEDGPEIWLDATATDFAFAADGRISSVTAQAPNDRRLTVTARDVVIAAGAIESTRLLLLADRQTGDRIFAPDDVIGRYFHDHLSVLVASIVPRDRAALNRVAGFRFEGSGMRNLRFEPSEAAEVRAQVPAGFAHIAFAGSEGSGFDALRDVFRQLQQRRLPKIATLLPLLKGSPWLARAVWWRLREHRLLYPSDADIELHMVIEQEPRADNRILLSPDRFDRYGQPLAAIDWSVGKDDELRLTRSTDLFLDFWEKTTLARLGTIERRPAGEAETEMTHGGGIYHPGGSTRMGRTPGDGVLGADLRTFRVPNLSVAATSAFPTGGGANPTMMLMMAALRLADRLASEQSPA